jgi:lipoprotein-releasing system permease protein
LNFEYFVAKRLNVSKQGGRNISKPIIKVAIIGMALGIAVMLISISVVTGFKEKIRQKVIGFGSHIQIINYDSNNSYETAPVSADQAFYPGIAKLDKVDHIQVFATKPGIIKTKENVQGVVLKGVGPDFKWDFFKKSIVEGATFNINDNKKTDSIIVSRHIADLLKLDVGQRVAMFFVQDPPRMRPFVISGIYETSMEELDKLFVVCDIKHIQKLNGWKDNQISGFEVLISDFDDLEAAYNNVKNKVGYNFDQKGAKLKVISIYDKYPQIFDWLNLLDMNVLIILILLIIVAGFNMISGLLIIILERTNMIGLLKALGSENFKIRNIFLYHAGFIIGKGLLWGNILGLILCYVQYQFNIINLDPATYYLKTVPINFNILHIAALNVGTLLVTLLILLLPSLIISKISPMKTIRFE